VWSWVQAYRLAGAGEIEGNPHTVTGLAGLGWPKADYKRLAFFCTGGVEQGQNDEKRRNLYQAARRARRKFVEEGFYYLLFLVTIFPSEQ
jgi:hypothetical protein